MNVLGKQWLPGDYRGEVIFDAYKDGSSLNLNGHRLTVDSNGIEVGNPWWSIITGNGVLTSDQSFLTISMHTGTIIKDASGKLVQRGLDIESVISGGIGLRVLKRNNTDTSASVVYLSGNRSNTFTGIVEVSGGGTYLALRKTGGAIAVQGDIHVSNGAVLRFDESQQMRTTSNVTLNNATLYHSTIDKDIITRFHRLTVEGSIGVVSFGSQGTHTHKRYLYLDELVIADGARIEVNEWAPERDFFLVKKTMNKEQLDAMMSKIYFRGWQPGATHLESYDKDYWAIMGTPEPETYGAIFGAVGVGLIAWRKRKCRWRVKECAAK